MNRPSVAISPVLVGAALGWQRTGALDLGVSLVVLAAALLMQVVSNLQNDVGYTGRGGEYTGTRTGLPRATQSRRPTEWRSSTVRSRLPSSSNYPS